MMKMIVSKEWMSPVPDNPLKVECRYCEVALNANLAELNRHSRTSKHVRNAAQHSTSAVEQRVIDTDSPVNGQQQTADG